MTTVSVVLLALLLDRLFKEPRRFHPLVGFGNVVMRIERLLNHSLRESPPPAVGRGFSPTKHTQMINRTMGIIAWAIAVLPFIALATMLDQSLTAYGWWHEIVAGIVLYLSIGWQSLLLHAKAVAQPLLANDLPAARHAVSMIVSRDTNALEATDIATAATESVLENGADAIFAAIFWFALLGIPGVVLYRLSNTLDAMWGYKNDRFLLFGWAAARIDDVLNFIPARLTALAYLLSGNRRKAWQAWREQAGNWKSPNAGPVMATGAGAINTALGGAAPYHGHWQNRPQLGPVDGVAANAQSIQQACSLVNRALLLWIAGLMLLGLGATGVSL